MSTLHDSPNDVTTDSVGTPTLGESLIANLEAQLDGYLQLVALARRQMEGLVGGRTEDVSLLALEQEQIILHLQKLERERQTLLSAALATDGDAVSIVWDDIITDLPASIAERLRALRTELLETTTTLRSMNQRNGRLLSSAARIVERWRTFMASSLMPPSTYSASGGLARSTGPRSLDQSA